MLKKERQIYILEKVKREGRAITNDLVEELGVAEDTIREDFQELSKKGLVRRIHGGVLRMENNIIDFNERITMNPTIKQQLAMKATELISGKSVVYIDGGTTNLKFAESLPKDHTGTIITNSPAIALALCEYKNIKINLIGGKLDPVTRIIKGTSSIKQIEAMNIECCILGVSSLSPENGITFPSFGEAELKKELIARSSQIIVIANKEKLGSVSTFLAADISAIDILVTNETDERIIKSYSKRGPQVIVYDVN